MKISNYPVYRWPAGSGAHTNAAAGVATAVNTTMFADQYRRDIWNAPETLQARAGAVRFTKRNCFDWCFITAYFPVHGQDPEGSASLTKWIDSVLSQLPTNCIPQLEPMPIVNLDGPASADTLSRKMQGRWWALTSQKLKTKIAKCLGSCCASITCKPSILGMKKPVGPLFGPCGAVVLANFNFPIVQNLETIPLCLFLYTPNHTSVMHL